MKQWQAKQIVTAYTDFGSATTGCACCAPVATVTALVNYVSHHDKLLQSAWDLYARAKIEPKEAIRAISSLEKSVAKTLTKALQFSPGSGVASAAGAAVGEAAVLEALEGYAALFAIGSTVVTIAVTAIISHINELHKDKPDEDEEEKKKKDVSVKILSITFQHAPDQYAVSAVRCRNRKGSITGPEWTSEKHCVTPALYIADHLQRVKIKVKYRITDNSKEKAGAYSVDLSATVIQGGENLFDQFEYKAQAQKDGVEYEVEMESSAMACVDRNLQFTQVKLWWDCRVNGKLLSLPNTLSYVYILPGVPDAPILLDKGCDSYFPAIEYLEIYTKLLKAPKPKREAAGRCNAGYAHVKQFTQMVFYAPCFRYRGVPTPEYVIRQMVQGRVVLTFMEGKFFDDVDKYARGKREPLEIECEVYAAVLGYYFRMLGVPFRLAVIANPVGERRLLTNPVYLAGHTEEPPREKEFEYHVVVETAARVEEGRNIPAEIYDASMGMEQDGEIMPFTALPFQRIQGAFVDAAQEAGTYRGIVMRDHCGAIISGEYVFV